MKNGGCVSAFSSQTAFLETQTATFTRHRCRLAVVRELKEKARLDMLGEALVTRISTQNPKHQTNNDSQKVRIQSSG